MTQDKKLSNLSTAELKSQVQSEALEEILKNKRNGVNLSPGMGKTLLGLKYIDSLIQKKKINLSSNRILVFVPKLDIIRSWQQDCEKFNLKHLLDYLDFSTYLSMKKLALKKIGRAHV